MMDQVVTCDILNIFEQIRFYLIVIYGHISKVGRKGFRKEGRKGMWNYLSVTNQGHTPWLIAGDFNSLLNSNDRLEGI